MMSFFKRNSEPPAGLDEQKSVLPPSLLQKQVTLFRDTVAILLHLLKAFALDIKEIQADRFKEELQELNAYFQGDENPDRLQHHFDQQKTRILAFIDRQQAYIADRETELRDIIDLLTRAMANLNVENREFYERIYDQSEKLIALSDLDDIKKIKNALKVEVEQMREIVHTKEDQEQRQIQLLAGQVVSLKAQLEKAREKSVTDGLTGIFNRQALEDALNERIERGRIVKNDFCILMIDVDNFKTINDQHGHVIGDRVLMALAQKLRNAIRSEDFLARYGGEEFTILLEGAPFRHALKKAQQICNAISSVRYATSETQTDNYLSITVSIGVSQFKKGDSAVDLINRSDQALYQAKRKGKNCVVGKRS